MSMKIRGIAADTDTGGTGIESNAAEVVTVRKSSHFQLTSLWRTTNHHDLRSTTQILCQIHRSLHL